MVNTTQPTALFLAAGTSSRYGGQNKLLLPFGGRKVVQQCLASVADAGVGRIVVVTGHQPAEVEAAVRAVALPAGVCLRIAHNPDYQAGEMLSSIQVGLRAALEEGTGSDAPALIALGDMPLLTAHTIRRLIDAFDRRCGSIVAPRYGKQRGHPVILGREWWAEALALPRGVFLRKVLAAHPEAVAHLEINNDEVLADVDTPEAYAAALERLANGPGAPKL